MGSSKSILFWIKCATLLLLIGDVVTLGGNWHDLDTPEKFAYQVNISSGYA
jgi:hypothetical protein